MNCDAYSQTNSRVASLRFTLLFLVHVSRGCPSEIQLLLDFIYVNLWIRKTLARIEDLMLFNLIFDSCLSLNLIIIKRPFLTTLFFSVHIIVNKFFNFYLNDLEHVEPFVWESRIFEFTTKYKLQMEICKVQNAIVCNMLI